MGHIGIKGLHAAADGAADDDSSYTTCEVCARANIHHSPFSQHSTNCAMQLLQCIHCDICGPLPTSYRNFTYFILFIDCHSRFISLFLMKSCSEAPQLFSQFQTAAKAFCKEKITTLHVNNAPELVRGQMEAHCATHGITYEKTVPDLPQQNGVAEWANRTICSMARAMLIDADLHDFFWPFAVLTATHIKQRVPHASLPPHTTPFELWYKRRPNLSHLRPFGTHCTAHIISDCLSKFNAQGESGRFLGYARDAKGYLIWVPNQANNGGTLKVRRDVVFNDTCSPNTMSAPIPMHYMPLWDAINFPDHIPICNNDNEYVHAWQKSRACHSFVNCPTVATATADHPGALPMGRATQRKNSCEY